MSDENDPLKFRIDLDAAEAVTKVNDFQSALKGLGNKENLSELIDGLGKVGLAVGVMGAAFFAVKEAFDLVFDAEKIKQVNAQFEIFSDLAGVAPMKLREGLQEASKGLVNETELMQAANKAMLEMQTGVEKLPEVMEIARKAASVMGGTTVEKFEQITQAISFGNQRMLKHAGIIVDVNKAYREYAVSQGITTQELSKAGQQQALLNAVLGEGSDKLREMPNGLKPATNAWQAFKTTMQDVGEVFTVAFNKIAGPTVTNFFESLKQSAAWWKDMAVAQFGEGAEQMAAKTKVLNKNIKDTTLMIDDIKNKKGTFANMETTEAQMWLTGLEKKLKEYQAELGTTKQKTAEFAAEADKKAGGADAGASKVDQQKKLIEEANFQKEMLALKQKTTTEEIKQMTSVEQADALAEKQRLQNVAAIENQIKQVRAQASMGDGITQAQAQKKIIELNKQKNLAMRKDDEQTRKMEIQALDNLVKKSKTATDGIGNAFKAMSKKNQIALKDWGTLGTKTADSLGSHMVGAFKSMGDGSKSAMDAMGGMFAGMVGDMAMQYGEMLLLSSIWPPNPLGLAAGAGLVALGAFLGSLGGGSSSANVSGGTISDSSGSGSAMNTASSSSPLTTAAASTTSGKQVTLVFQGPIMGDEGTKRWITDQVRGSADATDFTVQSVGGGF